MEFIKKHNIIPKVLAFLGAFVFWFIYVSSENPNVDNVWVHDVEVELIGLDKLEERGLVLLDNLKPTVSIKLSGTMKEVNDATINFEDYFEVQIDLTNIISPGNLSKTVKITNMRPTDVRAQAADRVTFSVDKIIESTVGVVVTLEGTPQAGYSAIYKSVKPTLITIKGPSTYLESIDKAVAIFDVSGITGSKDEDLQFYFVDSAGNPVSTSGLKNISWSPSSVTASVSVTHSRNVNLSVGFTYPDYLNHDAIITSITPEMVSISGAPEVVEAIHSISLGDINLKAFIEDDSLYTAGYVERVIEVPNGITSSVNGQSAKIFISIPGYAREKLILKSEFFPKTEGLEYLEEALTLTLFGREDSLALLDGNDFVFTPLFDLEGLAPGEHVVTYSIECADETVEVLESRFSITINVLEPEPEITTEPPATEESNDE